MRAALAVLSAAFLLMIGTFWWLKFDHHGPQVSLRSPLTALGRKTPVDFDVRSDAPGLRSITVRLQTGGASYDLVSATYPRATWRGSGIAEQQVHVEADRVTLKVPEGEGTLEVYVDTYGWHWRSAGQK